MTVSEAVSLLEGQFFCGEENASLEVASACGADLMSDVMAFVKDQGLLLTGLVNPQVIRTAELLDIHCIIFVRGKSPSMDMIDMAKESDIILGGTKLPMFIACGKLYEAGLKAGGTRRIQGLDKTALRRALKTRLAVLGPAGFTAAGEEAAMRLPSLPGWNTFRSVLAFVSLKDEIDTRPAAKIILAAKKPLFFPRLEGESLGFYRVSRRDLAALRGAGPGLYGKPGAGVMPGSAGRSGAFGIREPEPKHPLGRGDFPALVLCPGLAFDRSGRRLGRGGGFYDRFFAALDRANAGDHLGVEAPGTGAYTALGFCMDCQIVEAVPADPWDRAVRGIITEKRLVIT